MHRALHALFDPTRGALEATPARPGDAAAASGTAKTPTPWRSAKSLRATADGADATPVSARPTPARAASASLLSEISLTPPQGRLPAPPLAATGASRTEVTPARHTTHGNESLGVATERGAAAGVGTGTDPASWPEQYHRFAAAHTNPDIADPFALAALYAKLCHEHIVELAAMIPLLAPGSAQMRRAVYAMQLAQSERNTWQLIAALYSDRAQSDPQTTHADMVVDTDGTGVTRVSLDGVLIDERLLSDRQVVDRLYRKDGAVRQYQIVIDWLEAAARDAWPPNEDTVRHAAEHQYWPQTLRALDARDRAIGLGASLQSADAEIVACMDPDAPLREARTLHADDADLERRLYRELFALVRAGRLNDACNLCRQIGQSWRAASLVGGRLRWETLAADAQTVPADVAEGNAHWHEWRLACRAIAMNGRLDAYERAVYASISGSCLAAILAVSRSWEDALWAHYRCMLDAAVSRALELRARVGAPPLVEPPPAAKDADADAALIESLAPTVILDRLAASANETVRRQSLEDPYRRIQAAVIMDDSHRLLTDLAVVCERPAAEVAAGYSGPCCPPETLRMGVHLALFFRAIGAALPVARSPGRHGAAERVDTMLLRMYTKLLADAGAAELVALYTSKLVSPADQVAVYADFLGTVHDRPLREKYLRCAADAGPCAASAAPACAMPTVPVPADCACAASGIRRLPLHAFGLDGSWLIGSWMAQGWPSTKSPDAWSRRSATPSQRRTRMAPRRSMRRTRA